MVIECRPGLSQNAAWLQVGSRTVMAGSLTPPGPCATNGVFPTRTALSKIVKASPGAEMLPGASGYDVIIPSVIATDQLRKPLGRYYLYYAPHNAPGGICLAFADSPAGPWKEYGANPLITREWAPHYQVSHVSGPHALWIDEQRKLFLLECVGELVQLIRVDGQRFFAVGVFLRLGRGLQVVAKRRLVVAQRLRGQALRLQPRALAGLAGKGAHILLQVTRAAVGRAVLHRFR